MSLRRSTNHVQSVAVILALKHVEGLSESKVTEDVHGEVVAPVRHVLRGAPALAVGGGAAANLGAKGALVGQDVALHLLDGIVREGVRQDAALAGVKVAVARVVRVGRRVHKGVVELGLADIGAEAVDVLEGRGTVDRDAVGPESNYLACEDARKACEPRATSTRSVDPSCCKTPDESRRSCYTAANHNIPYFWCMRQNSRWRSPLQAW